MALNHLTLRRRELVWDIYECDYYDTDWATMKEFIQRQAENGNADAKVRWEAIKDVSFEDLMAMCNGDVKPAQWKLHSNWNSGYVYSEDVVELVKEWMRDEAWERGVVDSYSADDSEENLDVIFESNSEFLS